MARVLFFLPNVSNYVDRVRLLAEVSKGLDRLVLLVGKKDATIGSIESDRLEIVEAGYRTRLRPLNMWRASRIAGKIVDRAGINIVHDTFGNLLPLFRRKRNHPAVAFATSVFGPVGWRLKYVYNSHSPVRMLSVKSTALLYPNRWLEKRICMASDRTVVQAPGLVDRILDGIPIQPSQVAVLTNSVDTSFWRRSAVQARTRIESSRCRLLFVGGFDYPRGIQVAIEVMWQLKQDGASPTLRLVGGWGPFGRRGALKRISRHGLADSLEFLSTGGRDELRQIYQEADILLYQTRNDGSPRVVLEALSCGLPVIASHHPGIDVLDPEGDFIAFTSFGDAGKVVGLVKDFMANPEQWQERSRRGREAVVEKFDTASVAHQYWRFYNSLISHYN